jgi:hypothetical protein
VAKLKPMQVVSILVPRFRGANNDFDLRLSSLWNLKKTFHSRYMIKYLQSPQKRVGGRLSLGRDNMISATSWRKLLSTVCSRDSPWL